MKIYYLFVLFSSGYITLSSNDNRILFNFTRKYEFLGTIFYDPPFILAFGTARLLFISISTYKRKAEEILILIYIEQDKIKYWEKKETRT